MNKLKALQTFVQIVDSGSLTAAADALETSLTAVVRTLAARDMQEEYVSASGSKRLSAGARPLA